MADALNNLSCVEFVINEPLDIVLSGDIPPTTPLMYSLQGYHGPDPGIDVEYAWSKSPSGTGYNSRGDGITLTNVEFGWNLDHEDIPAERVIHLLGEGQDEAGDKTHGTATLGVLMAEDDGWGTTGLVPELELAQTAATIRQPDGSVDYDTALATAVSASTPGDLILLEVQIDSGLPDQGSDLGGALVPIEFFEPAYLLVTVATKSDILVVSAAGNGNVDLDMEPVDPENPTPAESALMAYQSRPDSGSIIVGAGTPDTFHMRQTTFSNYGLRVDLQAWGTGVLTTGCEPSTLEDCFLALNDDVNQGYFLWQGTSSATPMVASACASLQGLRKDRLGTFFDLTAPIVEENDDPNSLRRLLVTTGICQGGLDNCVAEDFEHIGPIPNLRDAIDLMLGDPSIALPFDDPFPETTIDVAKWPLASGAIDNLGDGEPSLPYSMHLGPGQSFETASMVTTNACTTEGHVQATLNFSYQDKGTGGTPNGDLVVRYRNDADPPQWLVLGQFPVDQIPGYVPQPIEIPSDGLHDAFRVRFESSATSGEWFVDDVHLDIISVPEFRLTPFTQTVCEGEAVDFTIEVVGGGTLTYQWKKDGSTIEDATLSSYTIASASASDSGDYTVVVTNECPTSTESTPGELTVNVPVTLGTISGPGGSVDCGDAVTLTVPMTGTPAPILTWFRDGIQIQSGASNTLVIDPVGASSDGEYWVEALDSPECNGELVSNEDTGAYALILADPNSSACLAGAPSVDSVFSLVTHGTNGPEIGLPMSFVGGVSQVLTEPRGAGLQEIFIGFNQVMNESAAETLSNYTLYDETLAQGVSLSGATATLSGGTDLTLLLSAPLTSNHCYTLTLGAGIVDTDNPANSLTGDTTFQFRPVPGDANQDGTVDPLDSGYVLARFGQSLASTNASADVNADGAIDPLDSGYVLARFGGPYTCP